jgi:hypothetical protein
MNPAKYGPQGDPEAPQLLRRLARRNPEHTWVLVGKNDRFTPDGLEANIENPYLDIPGGITYNVGSDPPAGSELIPFQSGSGKGYWINKEALARDTHIAEIIKDCDALVIHIGQHGCSHQPIPQVTSTWEQAEADERTHLTHPQIMGRNYGEYLTRGMNMLGDRTDGNAPVSYICVDPRNYLKARDIKWPTGTDNILAQHQYSRETNFERFKDPRRPGELGFGDWCKSIRGGELWRARTSYRHGGAELMILPDDWQTWGSASFDDRAEAGIATTGFYVAKDSDRRSWITKRYLLDTFPNADVYGKFDKKGVAELEGVELKTNTVEEFPSLLNMWRVTLSLPAVGSDWCVAKPYQCFAARSACFMIGRNDAQGWILPSRRETKEAVQVAPGLWSVRVDWTDDEIHLANWLRVNDYEEFAMRAKAVASSRETWEWITSTQLALLARRWDEALLENTIEQQLGIG